MVSIKYAVQKKEEDERKQRLVAARRAAADLSTQRARFYRDQKENQAVAVRDTMKGRWQKQIDAKVADVEQQIQEGYAQCGQGMQQAADYFNEMTQKAGAEILAWDAEHQLEDARHRLARVYQNVQRRQGNRSTTEREVYREEAKRLSEEQQKKALAAFQREQATRVPVTFAQPGEMAPMREPLSVRDINAFPITKAPSSLESRKRYVEIARDVLSAGDSSRNAEEAAAALCEEQQARARERARLQREEEKRIEERAAAFLRQKHEMEKEAQEMERRKQIMKQEVALLYRKPRVPEANTAANPYANVPEHGAVTKRQLARQGVRRATEDFESVFVQGPPVLVPFEKGDGALLPASLDVLLQPVSVQELCRPPLVDPLPSRADILMARQFRAEAVELGTASPSSEEAEAQPEETAPQPIAPADVVAVEQAASDAAAEPHETEIEISAMADHEAEEATSVEATDHPASEPILPPTEPVAGVPQPPTAPQPAADMSSLSDTEEGHHSTVLSSDTTLSNADKIDFTTSSCSTSSSHPAMTAEQLRIALLRLRNRMRAAQM